MRSETSLAFTDHHMEEMGQRDWECLNRTKRESHTAEDRMSYVSITSNSA